MSPHAHCVRCPRRGEEQASLGAARRETMNAALPGNEVLARLVAAWIGTTGSRSPSAAASTR